MRLHLHLVSDSTGETVTAIARATLSQFASVSGIEHVWAFVRTPRQVEKILVAVESQPGVILFTLVSPEVRRALETGAERLSVPCVSVLDPFIEAMSSVLGSDSRPQVGGQHVMNDEYFNRIEAMNFMLRHDDGLAAANLDEADVVLVGVSRTSKTPTSIYLANRGIKVANVPIVPDIPPPEALERLTRPLVVGLTISPDSLAQIRANRLKQIAPPREATARPRRFDGDYAEIERIKRELIQARRLFSRHGWPVIDVTRRSVEETAAAVLQLLWGRDTADIA